MIVAQIFDRSNGIVACSNYDTLRSHLDALCLLVNIIQSRIQIAITYFADTIRVATTYRM